MTDLHARLLEEIRRRMDLLPQTVYGADEILERKSELSTALRIAELHAPHPLSREPNHQNYLLCGQCFEPGSICDALWPCDTAKTLLDCYVPGWRV